MSESVIRIASIYPTLLGTYGDGGNVLALKHRAGLHGLATDVVEMCIRDRPRTSCGDRSTTSPTRRRQPELQLPLRELPEERLE